MESSESVEAWRLLNEMTGSYRGDGINHEREEFTGTLSVNCPLDGKMMAIESRAVGRKGEEYHREVSWIGPDLAGALTYYVASTNHPGITAHVFHRVETAADVKSIVFRFGQPDARDTFREEITFSAYADGSVSHWYAWGLPGGDFEPRSGSRMQKL